MQHSDIAALMKGAAPVIRDYVAGAVAPLLNQIADLEKRLAEMRESIPTPVDVDALLDRARGFAQEAVAALPAPEPMPDIKALVADAVAAIPPAEPGRSVTVADVAPLIDETVGKAVADAVKAIPRAADGKDGSNGRDGRGIAELTRGENGMLLAVFSDGAVKDLGRIVGEKGDQGPAGKDGAAGAPGDAGPVGPQGAAGEQGAQGPQGIAGEQGPVGPAGAPGANGEPGERGAVGEPGPQGDPGRDGKDGAAGEKGETGPQGPEGAPGEMGPQGPAGSIGPQGDPGPAGEMGPAGARGEKGADGKDGIGLADALTDDEGRLVLTMTDGRMKTLGVVKGKDGASGKDGAPGADGLDGLGFDDLTIEHDGERGFAFTLQRGERVKKFEFTLPVAIYRGVFDLGHRYVRGDVVTWNGSAWHCNAPTADKPGDGNDAWVLAVKRGKDAKELGTKGGS